MSGDKWIDYQWGAWISVHRIPTGPDRPERDRCFRHPAETAQLGRGVRRSVGAFEERAVAFGELEVAATGEQIALEWHGNRAAGRAIEARGGSRSTVRIPTDDVTGSVVGEGARVDACGTIRREETALRCEARIERTRDVEQFRRIARNKGTGRSLVDSRTLTIRITEPASRCAMTVPRPSSVVRTMPNCVSWLSLSAGAA